MNLETKVSEFGRIGEYLSGLVNGSDFQVELDKNTTYVAKLIALRNATSSLRIAHAPVMRTRPVGPPPEEPPQVGGGMSGWGRGGKEAEEGVNQDREPDGQPVPAVPHYDAQRFPVVARQQAGAVIGGGQVPPAPGAPGPDEDDNQPPQPAAIGNGNQ